MRKRIVTTLIFLIMCMTLQGCCLVHQWEPATCIKPETCKVCGQERGSVVDHSWIPANCVNPITCEFCGLTEGEALGHNMTQANCIYPATCTVCGATEGEKTAHVWLEATCIQPKHCAVCGESEGTVAAHEWIAASFSEPRTCIVCGKTEGSALVPYINDNDFNFSLSSSAEQAYTTITGYNDKLAYGNCIIKDYKKYTSNTSHPEREGYEWREVTVEFRMDRPCRVMWGYTDSYVGLSEYARTDYITFPDGAKEKVAATETFSSITLTPAVTPTPEGSDANTTGDNGTTANSTTTESNGTTGDNNATGENGQAAANSNAEAVDGISNVTPIASPTPTPTPESQPGMYILTATQAVQVPVSYKGLVFYVCNADYELDHRADDTFQFFRMD